MKKCYRCEEELTKLNSSVEHIIINACGGKLKSSNLLCASCNSLFGGNFDKELAKTTNDLANLLMIRRERGKPQKIKGATSDGKQEYYLKVDGDVSMTKPIINLIDLDSDKLEDRKINVRAPNAKILGQTLQGLKKKYPTLNIDTALQKAVATKTPFNEVIEIKSSIGGSEAFKSILKTAINFYILKGGHRDEIKHLFPYLENKINLDVVWMYYPVKAIYNSEENEVTHVLKLVGSPKERILYSYVELFNSHCFIVKLNTEYSKNEIDCDYVFNVHTHEVKRDVTHLSLEREEFLRLFSEKETKPFENVQRRFERVLKISHSIQHKNHLNKVISEAVYKSLADVAPGTVVDQKLLDRMRKEVFDVMAPFIKYK